MEGFKPNLQVSLVCALSLGLGLLTGPQASFANPPFPLTVAGAGFWGTDSSQWILLKLQLPDESSGVSQAEVSCDLGQCQKASIQNNAILFYYRPPTEEGVDSFRFSVTHTSGELQSFEIPVRIPTLIEPVLALRVNPNRFVAETSPKLQIDLGASEAPTLLATSISRKEAKLEDGGAHFEIAPPPLPKDAPSYLQFLATRGTQSGFAVVTQGTSVEAAVTLTVPVGRGRNLRLEGALNDVPLVSGDPDGNATASNVRVAYGTPIRAYSVRGTRQEEKSIVVPTGAVPVGLVVPIPGQLVADGGTGPTLAVAVPPDPFGLGAPVWPDIEVEGAKLVEVRAIGPRIKALILERPTQGSGIAIKLDGEKVASFLWQGGWGKKISWDDPPVVEGEDLRAQLTVTDDEGRPTSIPRPQFAGNVEVQNTGVGRYVLRWNSEHALQGELPPPLVLSGHLNPTPITLPNSKKPSQRIKPPPLFSLGIALYGGGVLSSLSGGGGRVDAEIPLPIWEGRPRVRVGAEWAYIGTEATLQGTGLTEQPILDSSVSGILFPLELGIHLFKISDFEVLVHGGLELRIDQGNVKIDSFQFGGKERTAIGARVGADLRFDLTWGQLFGAARLTGLGVNFSELSGDGIKWTGDASLLQGEIGFRVSWGEIMALGGSD